MSVLPVLATGSPVYAVLLMFGFYLLVLLIPIIPAVIIYWVFPEGKINDNSVEGSVGAWKIKAVGAWGAYVTAFVLGLWASHGAVSMIKSVGGPSVWTIDSEFQLLDEKGTEMEYATVEGLDVDPRSAIDPVGKHATITMVSDTPDPPKSLNVSLARYKPRHVPLTGKDDAGKDVLPKDGTISLTIALHNLGQYNPGTPPPRSPAGTGPAVVTSNP